MRDADGSQVATGSGEFIALGDQVYVHEDATGGHVSVEGFTQLSLSLQHEESLTNDTVFGAHAIFRLMPQQMYTMAKQLRSFDAHPPVNVPPEELRVRRDQMVKEAQREQALNESEVQNTSGREIRYGKVLQMQHVVSGKLVAVSHQASAHNRDARRVLVTDTNVGEAAWFRIVPRLRINAEGEKVRAGEPVLLENVMSGLKLHVGDVQAEINASGDGSDPKKTTFRLITYRQHEKKATGVVGVRGGETIRLIHRELDAYVGTSIVRAEALDNAFALNDNVHAAKSSSTMFIIEKADCRDGSMCRWEDSFRLRHVPSGMFLVVGTASDHPPSAADGGRRMSFFSAAASLMSDLGGTYQYKDRLRVLFTHKRDSAHTLFQFVPKYAPSGGNKGHGDEAARTSSGRRGSGAGAMDSFIGAGQLFGVQNLATKLWLHHESTGVDAESDTARVPKNAPAKSRWAGLKASVASHQVGIERTDMLGNLKSLLVATRERHDEDMLTLRRVLPKEYHDSLYIHSRAKLLKRITSDFVEVSNTDDVWALINEATAVLTELIMFTTESDNVDPFTREGLPITSRQLLASELQLFDLAVDTASIFHKYTMELGKGGLADGAQMPGLANAPASRDSHSDGPQRKQVTALIERSEAMASKRRGAGGSVSDRCMRVSILCQRLARHIIRGHQQNKKFGMRFVPQLQSQLGKGYQAAETLREVFSDNDEVLDMVTDDMIQMFVRLIRTAGRQARFVEFLRVLCVNNGKAVRTNQWRVCQMFILDAPELHVKLSIQNEGSDQQRVVVSADAQYFPAFVGTSELEVCHWLETTSPETAAYFERCVALYEVLVQGRNTSNTKSMQALLPYSVVTALIMDANLHEKHLPVSAQFVTVARALYVDTEPHQVMCKVRPIRVWDNIPNAALSGKLSSRLVTKLRIDWSKFDDVKSFITHYLSMHAIGQFATHLKENTMSLELIKLLYHLIESGFYRSDEVANLLPVLLAALDGRRDNVGGTHGEKGRYRQIKTIYVDTVEMMECKLWLCKVLQLVVTMRLDIRLSLLLDQYYSAWSSGKYRDDANGEEHGGGQARRRSVVGDMLNKVARDVSSGINKARRQSIGYLTMSEPPSDHVQIFDVLRFDADTKVDLTHILLDLTFYEHSDLVTMAMGLLVRHFDQRSVLIDIARESRLLVKPSMVSDHMKFDDVLRQLESLTKRRRLFDREFYDAVRLMSILSMHCYEESNEDGGDNPFGADNDGASQSKSYSRRSGGDGSVVGRRSETGTRISREGSGRQRGMHDEQASQATHLNLSEGTPSTYVHLVGMGVARRGGSSLTVSNLEPGERMLRRGDRIELESKIYKVRAVDQITKVVTLDRQIQMNTFGLRKSRTDQMESEKDVWIFVESVANYQNTDVQALLSQMGAHEVCLKFLSLPFEKTKVQPYDLHARAVACASYRLLRAMSTRFPLVQNALVPHLATFLGHTEARLVTSDISPTECILSVYKDNRIVCTQVGEDMVRHFVRLAANEHAPRYLRFLGMITIPSGQPVRRCQSLVLQCLLEKEEALLLFNGHDGMEKRDQLVGKDDHVDNPRGKLAYHIELITLFARCIEGSPPGPVMQLRTVMPLPQLMSHLLQDDLPNQLKRAYLAIFDELYLEAVGEDNPLQNSEAHADVLMLMDSQLSAIDRFVEDIAPVASFEDQDEISEANYIFRSVLVSIRLFYTNVYSRSVFGSSMDVFSRSLAHALLMLGQCSDSQPDVMPAEAVALCLDAIHSAALGLIQREALDSKDGPGSQAWQSESFVGSGGNFYPEKSEGSFSRKSRRHKGQVAAAEGSITTMGNANLQTRKPAMHPQERLLDFIAEFEKDVKAEIEKERHGLVEVFMNGGSRPAATKPKPPRSLSKRRSIASQLQAAERESTKQANTVRRSSVVVLSESSMVTYTRNLIWQLSNVDRQRDRSGARALTDMAVAQTTASLKVLISMLTMHKHDTTMRKRQQQLLTLLGAPTVVLVMASCENDELCIEGLKLGNALLEGGNRDVQAAIYKKLTDPAEEESIRAFDGSPNTFLSMMRRRLRLAKSEVRERKMFYDVQDEMRELMAEEYSTASSATLAQLQREVEREFPARSHVNEALEMLRLLCEGHNNDMQDLMHIQGGSISNVDLVGEAYELLAQLEPEIDESNISQMQKCIDTLVEFVQGNEAQIISAFLLDTKLLEILDRIIQKQSMPYIEQQELLDLQLSVALLLLALLEGKSHRAEVRMLSILDVRRLAALAGSLYDATLDLEDQDDEANGMSKAQREKANDTMLDVGSRIYMLVSHLLDSSEHIRDELGGANVGLDRDSVLYHLRVDEEERHVDLSYYRRYIARVELINANGQIEYAYFRFPAFCLLLTDDSKDRLLWGVDRSTPGRQIQSFFDSAQDLHQEMRHQESLNESHLWRVLTFNRPIALNAMFLIAIVQNSLIILSSAMTDSYGQSDDQLAGSTGVAQWIDAFVSSTLGMMQATACIVVFLVHAMQEGPLRMRMRRRQATGMTSDEIQSRIEKDTAFALWNSVMMPYYLLTDTKLLFYIFAFVAAVLGIARSPLFYAFHLLDMVNKSTDLQSVFRAVTQNGRAILMTAVFGFVVIYLYAIIGFAYGQDLFMAGDYPDGSSSNEFAEHPELSMCRNLYVCWVSAVVNGLREGDIGKIMEPRYSTDERYGFIVVYQFTYYLIVITVLLNVIFGIIIDTFGQLRTEAATKRASMENACFICGVDRFTFDTQGNGFLQHISVDHNMWHYLFMIIYLREKDPTDYNGWEQYVAKKMRANDTSFFPLNNAIVLKEHKEHQERGSVQLFETVQGMAHAISEMGHNLERVEKQFMDRVDTLTQQHRSLELALQNAFSQAGGQR